MSYDLNSVSLIGRLTRDPELKTTASGMTIAQFSIANGRGKDEANFFDIVAFGKTADFVGTYVRKGGRVAIVGKLRHERYTTKDGQNRSSVTINADQVQSLDSAKDREIPTTPDAPKYPQKSVVPEVEDSVPF